jgi:glutaredoxin
MKTLIYIISLVLISSLCYAEIYRWRDDKGNVHFGDRPPKNVDNQKVKVKINTYENAEIVDNDASMTTSAQPGSKQVVMYSTTWCGICKQAKQYFKRNSISYQEYDVEKSAKGKKDYAAMKGTGVPIILVGKKRMNGFNVNRFKQLYKGKS